MAATRIILVGGFLGAGKTTLLGEAARRLAQRGERVGLITNDQAPDLVDTNYLRELGFSVGEVAGSCFCCDFPSLIAVAGRHRSEIKASVILAEPVGSCTDLSATIVQPLKERYATEFTLAPLTVLADPFRLEQILTGRLGTLHPSAAYIFRKQLEEADWIAVNKVDQIPGPFRARFERLLSETFPGRPVKWISAKTGEGVEGWLDAACAGGPAGTRIPEVDYDTYAEGEAVLGWLNAEIALHCEGEPAADANAFCLDLMECLRDAFAAREAEIGHAKLILSVPGEHMIASLTRADGEYTVTGRIGRPLERGNLVINLRVQMPPEDLEAVCRECLAATCGGRVRPRVLHQSCLRPGRPVPTHRYTRAVG